MGDDFGQCLPEEEAVCTSTSEEENIMFGPNTPYDPIPKKCEGVSPLLAECYGFGRRFDTYSPINYGGKETYCPSPGTTPTTSRGTYRTQPAGPSRQGTYTSQPAGPSRQGTYVSQPAGPSRQGTYVSQRAGPSRQGTYVSQPAGPSRQGTYVSQPAGPSRQGTYVSQPAGPSRQGTYVSQPAGPSRQGTYGVPGGQQTCPPPSGGRVTFAMPSTSNRETYGVPSSRGQETHAVPSTSQEPDPAQIAAQIVAKFQSTCGSTVQQLQNLAASTPSSARLQTGGSGCPSPTGTSGSSNYSAPSWRSGYDASVSSPGYGGGFSPPPYGMMMASPARTYDTSSDAVSPCPRTPANSPKRQLPPPPSGKAGACSRPCSPAASASGNSKYVRPNLENILKVVQFGMGSFLQLKSCNLEKMESALITYRIHLDHGMKVMKEVDDAISCDLESLPQLIKSWGEHAQYLQILYDKSIKKPRPSPNLSAIEHPSACVNQNAYTELLKAGKSLCLEVERGLRVAEVFNSKLDTVVGDTTDEMMKTYNQICSLKETRDSMAAETQEWMRRFKEVEHSVNNFLCEWQKGGDHLNQPVPDTCAPPILDLDQLQPNQPQPSSCAQYSQAQPKQPQSSSCAQYSQAQSQPSSCAQYSPAANSSPDYTTTSDDSEEFKTRGANIERLGKVLEGKKEELASLIERFASMNTSIHLEVQQNMDQQEVLNESLRAMDDIQSPPAKSQISPA